MAGGRPARGRPAALLQARSQRRARSFQLRDVYVNSCDRRTGNLDPHLFVFQLDCVSDEERMSISNRILAAALAFTAMSCTRPGTHSPAEPPAMTQAGTDPMMMTAAGSGGAIGSAGTTAVSADDANPKAKLFLTEPVKPGYQRFEPPAIDVPVGGSEDWAQWVGGPLDQDYDVIDINGMQSVGGHHALVYATTDAQMPGTTRLWQDQDQVTARLMGGIGGEGGANVNLPAGIVFRVKKGSYILIQTHYLNTSESPIVGRTVIDVSLSPVDPSRRVASMMSNTSLAISLPPHEQTVMDIECAVQKDLQFLQISNHMHDMGTTTVTDFVDPEGAVHVLKDDVSWSGDLALNPNFTKFPVEAPGFVPKGSMLRTRCTWFNTADTTIKFPAEMCVFFGFVLNDNDLYCIDGKWSEASSGETMAAAGASAPGSGGTGAGSGGQGGSDTSAGAAEGCTSMSDQDIMNAAAFDQQSTDCATPCGLDPDVAACTTPCFENTVGLSHACAVCNAVNVACGAKACLSDCLADSAGMACRSCVEANCDPAFRMCTGT